jgi:hypothetical protein
VRTIGSTSQFLGWSDPAAHFGLGATAVAVHVEVRLPGADDAIVRDIGAGAIDRTLTVPEPIAGAACVAIAALIALSRARARSYPA